MLPFALGRTMAKPGGNRPGDAVPRLAADADPPTKSSVRLHRDGKTSKSRSGRRIIVPARSSERAIALRGCPTMFLTSAAKICVRCTR